MLRGIRAEQPVDVRELVVQRASTGAAHDEENRAAPEVIEANYASTTLSAIPFHS